jgi:hypothetical protein
MSVTIIPSNCPEVKRRIECVYCTSTINPECLDCNGQGYFEVSEFLFELNLSNTNFHDLMAMLGREDLDACGRLEGEQIAVMRRAIMHARNSGKKREEAARPTVQEGNFTFFGQSGADISEKIEKLDAICRWAQENNEHVTWG